MRVLVRSVHDTGGAPIAAVAWMAFADRRLADEWLGIETKPPFPPWGERGEHRAVGDASRVSDCVGRVI
jgi:hypothetical protein